MPDVKEYNVHEAMDGFLNKVIAGYETIDPTEFRIVSTTIDPFGIRLGCKVVWSPRDKKLFPITLLTEYGIIKVRSRCGERLVKEVDEEMCAFFNRLAQE